MHLTLEEIKAHLNIDAGHTADDALLLRYAEAAEAAVAEDINCPLERAASDGSDAPDGSDAARGGLPAPLRLACLMLTAQFYACREPVAYGVTAVRVPYTVEYLLAPYRVYDGAAPLAPKNAEA